MVWRSISGRGSTKAKIRVTTLRNSRKYFDIREQRTYQSCSLLQTFRNDLEGVSMYSVSLQHKIQHQRCNKFKKYHVRQATKHLSFRFRRNKFDIYVYIAGRIPARLIRSLLYEFPRYLITANSLTKVCRNYRAPCRKITLCRFAKICAR